MIHFSDYTAFPRGNSNVIVIIITNELFLKYFFTLEEKGGMR